MAFQYDLEDFQTIAVGAAVLGSGGGGSYTDACNLIAQLGESGWSGTVDVRDYDATTDACVLAMMGSPDAAENLTLDAIKRCMANTRQAFETACGASPRGVFAVEIGPINSTVPLIAAALSDHAIKWVADADGAGRAVPQLQQTIYAGAAGLSPGPCVLANDGDGPANVESACLNAASAGAIEALAGGIVNAFGSDAGIMLWPSIKANDFALKHHYLPGTLEQTRKLGQYLRQAATPPTTAAVAAQISGITARNASAVLTNVYITDVKQATSSASLDVGILRLSDHPDPAKSRQTHSIYNMNENLILYCSEDAAPVVVAPDSICYYSEHSGRGFSNAFDDLASYYDRATRQSTGVAVSVLKIEAAPAFRDAPGVAESFGVLLRGIGYGGRLISRA
ncbi:hypothetical protein T5B8_18493 [Salinisphaera sp. T5B8]|uniref:S-methyl thiohydantoin desulfurase domain-containing protein n=1 Tax=Salinisphaera sp. T5B8 TaxID=1304154 RepID=UPI003341784B